MIALQLYTVRERTAQDFIGTLRQLADMGYRTLEFAGYGDTSVSDLRSAMDEYGLQAISAHVPFTQLENSPQQAIADLHALGCKHAVVPGIPEDRRSTVEQVRSLAETFNGLAQTCNDEGLQFGYHNHAHEFEPLDGSTMFELIAENTDPALVNLELDLFWAQVGGADPLALMRRYAGRMPLLHCKDMMDDAEHSDAPVGEGILPYQDYMSVGTEIGAEWYIVEQDHPRNAMEDVRTSLRNLEKLSQSIP
ncbi:MAG: sugar phosphate isomerase/epimerase [Chloroflexota bacterium]|nr:sugar phosphate isomerase/epimerase [Chloroflexota bacterium]